MTRYRNLGLGMMLALGVAVVACADDNPAQDDVDTADGGVEAGRGDTGAPEGGVDSGTKDADVKDAGNDGDADADAGQLPGVVSDLAGTANSHTKVTLTWTAPPDYTGSGTVADYEVRYATTPITTEADFIAATALESHPSGEAPGTAQTVSLDELMPETQYYVALRARYDNDDLGPLSNIVAVTTKARATLLISEIAPANNATSGGDFVELVASKAGYAGGLTVHHQVHVLHTFGPLEVQVGDRIVIHLTGLPGPTGFAQEDTAGTKTASTEANASGIAYDVYSAETDLVVELGALTVAEAGDWLSGMVSVQDFVPYGDRSIDDPDNLNIAGLVILRSDLDGYWPHPLTEEEWMSEEGFEICRIYSGILNASGDDTAVCGGPPGGLRSGWSFQRNGVVDTDSEADFSVAPQTRGTPN